MQFSFGSLRSPELFPSQIILNLMLIDLFVKFLKNKLLLAIYDLINFFIIR